MMNTEENARNHYNNLTEPRLTIFEKSLRDKLNESINLVRLKYNDGRIDFTNPYAIVKESKNLSPIQDLQHKFILIQLKQ